MAAKKGKAKKARKRAVAHRATSRKPNATRRATKKLAPKTAKKTAKAVTKPAKKAAPKPKTAKKTAKAVTKPAKKAAPKPRNPAKKIAPPKRAPSKPVAPASPPVATSARRSFTDKVRDCVSGTPVWYTVAGGIEHAEVTRRGADSTVVIHTDGGATVMVASSNLFETADEARAARNR